MQRVTFATTGSTRAPSLVLGQGVGGVVRLPNIIAICERDDGSIWLVDAGFSVQTCEEPNRLGTVQRHVLGLEVKSSDALALQMRAAGLDPAKVTAVIATHLHFDHVGGVEDFPNAELITTHDEVTEAFRGAWQSGYRRHDLDRIERLRCVQWKRQPCVGFLHSAQLDDDITLLDARGHTHGHVAVLIRNGSQCFLHAGDAAYLRRDLDMAQLSPLARMMAYDQKAVRQTHRALIRSERSELHPQLILSHDPDVLPQLPKLSPAASA